MKKILKILVLVFILVSFATISKAANVGVTLTPSSKKVKKGAEVTVEIKVNNFTREGDQKAIEMKLGYDTNALEFKSYQGKNNWSIVKSSDNTGFVASKEGTVNSTETVMAITFKVKENAALGSTRVTVSDILTSSDGDEEETEPASTTIEVIAKESNSETPDNENENEGTGENDGSGKDSNLDGKGKNNDTQGAKGDGEEDGTDKSTSNNGHANTGTTKIILPIGFAGIISVISFLAYRKYRVF